MRDTLRVAFVGSVDDGKSTLIGRLLVDTGALFADHLKSLQTPNGIELSWVTDGLLAEREQGITIDVAYRHFKSLRRDFIIADVPGHEAHVGNMLSGASFASLAVVLIDAERGVSAQTYRHLAAAQLAGIKHLIVTVNKMDLVGFSRDVFNSIEQQISAFTTKLQFQRVDFVPVSGLLGDGVVTKSLNLAWYAGEPLLELLETAPVPQQSNADLRLPIQTVLRHGNLRYYAGRILSGRLKPGLSVQLEPSHRTAVIKDLLVSGTASQEAQAGDSVAVSLTTEEDLSRGELICTSAPTPASEFFAKIVWIARETLNAGSSFILRHETTEARAEVTAIEGVWSWPQARLETRHDVQENEFANVHLKTSQVLSVDLEREGSRFVLIDRVSSRTVGAGTFLSIIEKKTRTEPVTVWLTGLPGAGKSTLAEALQKRFRDRGETLAILDGDVVRTGLCHDLGFTDQDRTENSRRVAEVCKLLNSQGVSTIVALVSPITAAREQARKIIGPSRFVEAFVDAPLAVCQQRDPKGLYARASRGEVKGLTGVDAPYESPKNPHVHLQTDRLSIEDALKLLERAMILTVEDVSGTRA